MYGAFTQGEGQIRPGSIRELPTRQNHRRVGSCAVIPFALELSGQPHSFVKPLIFPLAIIMTSKLTPSLQICFQKTGLASLAVLVNKRTYTQAVLIIEDGSEWVVAPQASEKKGFRKGLLFIRCREDVCLCCLSRYVRYVTSVARVGCI